MSVFAVVVAYHPDLVSLELLSSVLGQAGAQMILVDNTEGRTIFPDRTSVTVLSQEENRGVAAAFNIGIRHALSCGAHVVVLFDQDSAFEECFLDTLLGPLVLGVPGVSAPLARDRRTGAEYPSHRIGRFGLPSKVYSAGQDTPVPVDIVMSSGCAATAEAYERVGLLDEDFFIDFVDTEWCLRCRSQNVPIVIVPGATMSHAVGDGVVSYGPFRGSMHSPMRSYYKTRNCFLLFRKRHVPKAFAIHRLVAGILNALMVLRVVDAKRGFLSAFTAGILDGLSGATGKKRDGSVTTAEARRTTV